MDQGAVPFVRTTEYAYSPDEGRRNARYSSYVQGLTALRRILSDTASHHHNQKLTTVTASHDDVLLAVALLACLECTLDTGGTSMYKHVLGVSAVLTSGPLFSKPSEAAAALLYWHWMGTFQIPVAFGRPSPFDTPAWLELETTSHVVLDNNVAKLRKIGYNLFIRLPRLIAQARSLRERGTDADPDAVKAALNLAHELQRLDGQTLESSLLHRVQVRKTTSAADSHLIPHHLRFPSPNVFQPLIYYWHTHIILNRLCLTLHTLAPFRILAPAPTLPTPAILRAENQRLVTNLAMYWPFASTVGRFGTWAMCLGWIAV